MSTSRRNDRRHYVSDPRYTRQRPHFRPVRQRRWSPILIVLLLPLVLGAIIYVVFSNLPGTEGDEALRFSRTGGAETSQMQETGRGRDVPVRNSPAVAENGLSDYEYFHGVYDEDEENGFPMRSVSLTEIRDTGYMALVNRRHAAPPSSHAWLTGAWPTVAVSRVEGMYLHKSALRAVSEMFATARDEDIAAFFVSSGYRSFDAQVLLYGDGSNSLYVQPPGHSEHHTGLAADILAPGIGMGEMANSPEGQWLAANSYRYGLILRYPYGATHITGIAFEPWHFRYVGRVHAYYMKRNNLVLEEYIARIMDRGHFYFEKGGQTFHVMHQLPQDGMIYVPYGLESMVSGDNKGGFIVLAW